MEPQNENNLLQTIQGIESGFAGWLGKKLYQKGIDSNVKNRSFPELLKQYENCSGGEGQYVPPLLRWTREKEKCFQLKEHVSKEHSLDRAVLTMLEETAMSGTVLLLTVLTNTNINNE